MQVRSLDELEKECQLIRADICIVGAGAAGLYLARRLEQRGVHAIVLEAGPKAATSTEEIGFDAIFAKSEYRGATDGRAFGVGGTTSRWGGQLIPYLPADGIRANQRDQVSWNRILSTIELTRAKVAQVIGIAGCATTAAARKLSSPDGKWNLQLPDTIYAHQSTWLPFRKRNFSWLAGEHQTSSSSVTVFHGAVVNGWNVVAGTAGRSRVAGLTAIGMQGRKIEVLANQIVIAAGALESSRILLELNLSAAGQAIRTSAAIGQYLSDHLSLRIARTKPTSRRIIANTIGPVFTARTMRTWRFIETNPTPSCPRYFAHFIFPSEDDGFLLARTILQDIQAHKIPGITPRMIWRGGIGIAKLAWERWVNSRLHIADGAPSYIQIDMEQRPCSGNRIELDRAIDRNGRPKARIAWEVSEQDRLELSGVTKRFLGYWASAEGSAEIEIDEDSDPSLKPHDAYHPVGACRMGDDPEAVVGFDLRVHGIQNAYVLSTAIFPSSGSANPTFSLLCFAEMMSQTLSTQQA